MSHPIQRQYFWREQLCQLQGTDPLGVLSSTREVVVQARSVQIDPARIASLARELLLPQTEAGARSILPEPAWPAHYHFFDGTEQTVNWILVLDALNFCFWGERGQPRWQILYRGEMLDGYWAEAAALRRAMEEQVPLGNAEYLSNMDHQKLATLLRGASTDQPGIPLFEERLRIIREVGEVLSKNFAGQFSHLVEQMRQSAVALVLALVENFPSFRDKASYENQEVYFFKRAQICVADLASAFQGQSWGTFNDLDQLTIFADYKLPQVLRHSGALVYARELADKVDQQEQLTPGGMEEVELRAATIWACELLRREVANLVEQPVTASHIDQLLWHLGQDARSMQPYHRVRTIYY